MHESSATGALRVHVARGADFASLLDERWNALVRRQALPNPTLSATWLRAAAAWEPGLPLVVAVERRDRLVAGGAFGLSRPLGRVGPAVATWLGNRRLLFSPDLLVDPDAAGAEEALWEALAAEAAVVRLYPTRLDGLAATALRARAPWRSMRPCLEGWVTALPPTTIERRLREAAYERRRAERAGARISVSVAADPDAVAPSLERLFRLHRQRWAGHPTATARFSGTKRLRHWFRHTLAALAARGEVRIAEVLEDGVVVASGLALLTGRGALYHTTASRVGGRLKGPGHVAALAVVEALIEAGAEVLDLGRGSARPGGFKADLAPTRVASGSIVAARSHAVQRCLDTASLLRRAAGSARRRGRVQATRSSHAPAPRSETIERPQPVAAHR